MARIYTVTPEEFHKIEPYVICERNQIAREILLARKCCFYDACSLRKHAQFTKPEILFSFLRKIHAVVVLTRCILMELCSMDGKLQETYIEYIKAMADYGIQVLVIYEEDLYSVLSLCFSSKSEINTYLSLAVKHVKVPTGTVEETLKSDSRLREELLVWKENGDRNLFGRFFEAVRANKEPEDNLGEELLAICLHMLSAVSEQNTYKYIVLTEDKGAVGLLKKTLKNVEEYFGCLTISVLTTPRLLQKMWSEGLLVEKAHLIEMLKAGNANEQIKVFCTERYDIVPMLKTMSYEELAEKIVVPDAIHVNY